MIVTKKYFSIKTLGRAGIEYKENNFIVLVDGEMLMGPSGYVIYKDNIKVLEGDVVLDDNLKNKIITNIKAVFAEQGFDIEIR